MSMPSPKPSLSLTAHKALGGGLRISKALVKGKALAKGTSKALADFSHASRRYQNSSCKSQRQNFPPKIAKALLRPWSFKALGLGRSLSQIGAFKLYKPYHERRQCSSCKSQASAASSFPVSSLKPQALLKPPCSKPQASRFQASSVFLSFKLQSPLPQTSPPQTWTHLPRASSSQTILSGSLVTVGQDLSECHFLGAPVEWNGKRNKKDTERVASGTSKKHVEMGSNLVLR
ncbi:hypothetical protein B0H14DRAFT_2610772 [Mycena olivaceomarginata]|nr:hypothetical protein B0H14DRAFT_2610772 [Mycena olivaceomarginata]